MRSQFLRNIFVLCFICFASVSVSDDSSTYDYPLDRYDYMLDEAKFKVRFKEVIGDGDLTYKGTEENAELCHDIFQEIENDTYELIKPVAHAESYDDPAFDDIRNQCPELPLDYSIHSSQILEKCTAGFFAWIGDFDNNPENGDEYMTRCERVIYEALRFPSKSYLRRTGRLAYDNLVVYNVSDVSQCKLRGRAVSFEYDYQNNKPNDKVSMPIKFKGRTYLLYGGFSETQYKHGYFWAIDKFRPPVGRFKPDSNPYRVCTFSNIKKKGD